MHTLDIGGASTLGSDGLLTVYPGATFNWTSSANQTIKTVPTYYFAQDYGFVGVSEGTINLCGSGTVTLPGAQGDMYQDPNAPGFTGTWNIAQNVDQIGNPDYVYNYPLYLLPNGLGWASAINIQSGGTLNIKGDANTFEGNLQYLYLTGRSPYSLTIEAGGTLHNYSGNSQTISASSMTLNGGTISSTEDLSDPIGGSFVLNTPITVAADSTISAANVNLGDLLTINAGKTLTLSGDFWDWGGSINFADAQIRLLLTGSIDSWLGVAVPRCLRRGDSLIKGIVS